LEIRFIDRLKQTESDESGSDANAARSATGQIPELRVRDRNAGTSETETCTVGVGPMPFFPRHGQRSLWGYVADGVRLQLDAVYRVRDGTTFGINESKDRLGTELVGCRPAAISRMAARTRRRQECRSEPVLVSASVPRRRPWVGEEAVTDEKTGNLCRCEVRSGF
jgi:hypothetical protein